MCKANAKWQYLPTLESAAIIAHSLSRDVRNALYKERAKAKNIDKALFPIDGMEKLFVKESFN